jgi:2-iminobutanoate/2-iminopropanoate deaminase
MPIVLQCNAQAEKGDSMREVISTSDAPRSIGPFSQAVRAGGFVFVSGQVALDPATMKVIDGDIAVQTEQTLKNVTAILAAAGLGLANVVRSGVYLRNMNDFAAMNAVYAQHFPSEPPARTTIEVARLPLDVLVEIDVVALM